jgi:ATP-binding cassette, subfamily C, bacterial exporter for protease/lipase
VASDASQPDLTSLLKRFSSRIALIGALSIVTNVMRLITPVFLILVVDHIVASRSISTLLGLTSAAMAGVIAGSVADAIRRRMLFKMAQTFEGEVGPLVVTRSLSSDYEKLGDTSVMLGQTRTVGSFISRGLIAYIDVLFAPLFISVVFWIHPMLGLLCLVGVMVLIIMLALQRRLAAGPRETARSANQRGGRVLASARQNRESVGGLTMGPALAEQWAESREVRKTAGDRINRINTAFGSAVSGFGRILRISIIACGLWLFFQGSATLGGLIAARVLAGFAYRFVRSAARSSPSGAVARAAFVGLNTALAKSAMPEVSLPREFSASSLLVESVSFRYPGGAQGLIRHLSFALEPSQLLLVTGSGDAGKTTLARLLVGQLRPKQGRIRIGDVDVDRLPDAVRSEMLSYAPQQAELFQGTVRNNIARLRDCPFEAVIEAAEMVGIHEEIRDLPEGYDTLIGRQPFEMSASKRKRIALARAFLGSPKLIVLDEPFANLDPASRRKLQQALLYLKSAGSIIIVTQSLRTSRLNRVADKILNLNVRPLQVRECGLIAPPESQAHDGSDHKTKGKRKQRLRRGASDVRSQA